MANGASSLERDFASVQEEITRLRADVASLTETLKEVSNRQAQGMADAVRQGLDGAAQRVRGASKRLKSEAQEAALCGLLLAIAC
ncbi:MAG TPA: hypothetical protein PLR41_12230 [Alphaproteobacteria bacterium]|nr:hypothetical protein [Alphaproteobacteria bacterium]